MSLSLPFRSPNGVLQEVEVEASTTIAELQEKICNVNRLLPRGRIALYLNKIQLQPNNSVREYNLKPPVLPPENGEAVVRPVVTVIILYGNPDEFTREDR
jgi:hypothetical protein